MLQVQTTSDNTFFKLSVFSKDHEKNILTLFLIK